MKPRLLRLSEETHTLLQTLAEREGAPLEAILARALADFSHKSWLKRCEAEYAALPKQPSDESRPRKALRAAWNATFGVDVRSDGGEGRPTLSLRRRCR